MKGEQGTDGHKGLLHCFLSFWNFTIYWLCIFKLTGYHHKNRNVCSYKKKSWSISGYCLITDSMLIFLYICAEYTLPGE